MDSTAITFRFPVENSRPFENAVLDSTVGQSGATCEYGGALAASTTSEFSDGLVPFRESVDRLAGKRPIDKRA